MARYVINYTKQGYIKYTSHLDMLRLFKRAFKRSELNLLYSHGFNPHPKMGFAQPLSLGYESLCEMIEFEIKDEMPTSLIAKKLAAVMPDGIIITKCEKLPEGGKSLAALTIEASHNIRIPLDCNSESFNIDWSDTINRFMAQNEIIVMKPQKKAKKESPLNIRNMIRALSVILQENSLIINVKADCGSASNLSPELLLKAFLAFSGLETDRSEIEITRTEIVFGN